MSQHLAPVNTREETALVAPALAVELPDTDYKRVIRFGSRVLLFGLGGFLLWACFAPLDEGIPAAGVVSVESSRKRIDHLAGGIVEKIWVREGQLVKQGDELVSLNEVQAQASYQATQTQWFTAAAGMARLQAERDRAAKITFPPELLAAAEQAEAAQAMKTQEALFRSRRSAIQGELRIIQESIAGLESQLASLSKLRTGREKQVELFNEQLASFQKLKAEGYVSRNYLMDIERQLAEIQSRQSEDLANIAGTSARLSEFRMRSSQKEFEYSREVESQLSQAQRDASILGERLAAQKDTVQRLSIRAPVSGTVVDLAVHTVGGAIKPGERVMDIVPKADALVIEAKIDPQHIDRLHAGLPADVHFDAYSHRVERPVVTGRVDVVSADALLDQRSGLSYYTIRVTVPSAEVNRLGDLKLVPGMQSTVMVKTGERTLMVYLTRPLLRRFTSALKE
jgi:protease secretion system membrane fusion protein